MYYRNAQAAVVVYDVTKASSLEKAKSWVKELQRQANPNIVIALAGNKVDLVTGSSSIGQSSATSAPNPESEDEEADDATATPGENVGEEGSETLRQVPKDEAQAYAVVKRRSPGCTRLCNVHLDELTIKDDCPKTCSGSGVVSGSRQDRSGNAVISSVLVGLSPP